MYKSEKLKQIGNIYEGQPKFDDKIRSPFLETIKWRIFTYVGKSKRII